MVLTEEMNQAFQTIEETTDNLFITGKAGTGKTTFLKHIVEHKIVAVPFRTLLYYIAFPPLVPRHILYGGTVPVCRTLRQTFQHRQGAHIGACENSRVEP